MSTNDGLTNVASGLGTAKSKREHNTFVLDDINHYQHLEAAYITDWLAAKIIDVPVMDSVREWRAIKCKDAELVEQAEKEFDIVNTVKMARTWAALYGGGGVLMVTNQDLEKPLNLNALKKGSLKRLLPFDRVDLTPVSINQTDILATNYLQPDFYNIRGGKQKIHYSHIARFNGIALPLRYMAMTHGWGDSQLRKCIKAVTDLVSSVGGIAELMQEANVDVINREGLTDELASDQDDDIVSRYALFSQMKSIVNMALLDGGETYSRNTLALGGVAPIIEQFMTWISGAANMPTTKLFETSASGMNATGEGDADNYRDRIKSDQTSYIDPGLKQIDQVMIRSALGYFPDDFDYQWNPLEQINDLERAQALQLTAQANQLNMDMGVVTREQIMRNYRSAEVYQYEDEDIESAVEYDADSDYVSKYAELEALGFDSESIVTMLSV
jgi:uncharacterized protein